MAWRISRSRVARCVSFLPQLQTLPSFALSEISAPFRGLPARPPASPPSSAGPPPLRTSFSSSPLLDSSPVPFVSGHESARVQFGLRRVDAHALGFFSLGSQSGRIDFASGVQQTSCDIPAHQQHTSTQQQPVSPPSQPDATETPPGGSTTVSQVAASDEEDDPIIPKPAAAPDGPKDPEEADEGTPSGGQGSFKEYHGPAGPEPTRYGDWEKSGRCYDF